MDRVCEQLDLHRCGQRGTVGEPLKMQLRLLVLLNRSKVHISDVTVAITMSNTDFPDDTATGSDVHTGDCIPVFEPTVTFDMYREQRHGELDRNSFELRVNS